MAEHFYGTTLTVATNTIEEITSISGPTLTVDETETSSLGSANQWKTFFPTWKSGGEVTVKCNYDMDNPYQDSIVDLIVASTQATAAFVLTFPDASSFSFTGFVSKLTPSGEVGNDKLELEFTVKITGAVTYSPGA